MATNIKMGCWVVVCSDETNGFGFWGVMGFFENSAINGCLFASLTGRLNKCPPGARRGLRGES